MKSHLTTKTAVSLAVLLSIAVTLSAQQSKYEQYYTDLPVEIEHVQPVQFPATTVLLSNYGAIGDGETLCTEAFRAAIKDLEKQGGGHLIVPKGVWKTGPIVLKSNIDLHLNRGAVIRFSEDKSLYVIPSSSGKEKTKADACIKASKCENVGITGKGILDGQGFYWRPIKKKKVMKDPAGKEIWESALALGGVVKDDIWYPFNLNNGIPNIASNADDQEKMRSHLINITDSKNVIVQGVTITNSPKFHLVPTRCQNLIIDGVTVDCPWWAQNGDAMDIGNTQVCLVVNCNINCGDDGICMKGGVGDRGRDAGPNRDFLIMNDTVYRAHGGFVIGSEFCGGMQRLIVRNCVFDGTDIGLRFKSAPGRGGWCEDIICQDIVMKQIRETAIFFESGYADRAVGRSATATDDKSAYFPDWGNFTFRNIVCVSPMEAVTITGLKGKPVHDLLFDNVQFYGVRSSGLTLKHAEKLTFKGCTLTGGDGNNIDRRSCKDITWNGKNAMEE
ncbi:MAG: glycoside hydrolase family 28 protein [Bacteroidales bacterium]|nr:glycoside hydrolase family 28 protein [Bacteroidales bacterium]